jgi:hypothetical protein
MQFGKVHGIALVVLGLILIGVQVSFAFAGKNMTGEPSPQSSPTSRSAPPPEPAHQFGPLAGILGAISLCGGIAIFATAHRRDEPPAQHAVK